MTAPVKSLFLESFQSHSKTKIDLPGPGQVCVIVGPTDSGKTAIVRALRLLMYNTPTGLDYVQVGKTTATVAVELNDGTKVARERGKSVNRYRIARPGGTSPQTLEGFGTSVPFEVHELTGVRTVSIGEALDLALNLSEQLDGPFLGNKTVSGPARAKVLGALANTEEVDEAHRALGVDLHRAGQRTAGLLDEISSLDRAIAGYDYLPVLASQIEALTAILEAVRDHQARLASLESLQAKLAEIDPRRARALATLGTWKGLPAAASHAEHAESALTKTQALTGYRSSLESVTAQRGQWSQFLTRWTNLRVASDLVAQATADHARRETLGSLLNDLTATAGGLERTRIVLHRWVNLQQVDALTSSCSDALMKAQSLQHLRLRVVDLGTEASRADQAHARWAAIAEAESLSSSIAASLSRFAALGGYHDSLSRIRDAHMTANADLDRHSGTLDDARAQYADTLIALGRCPLCGSTVDPASIRSHVKEVA